MESSITLFLMVMVGLSQLINAEDANIHEEVYNGYNAQPGQFPYQALLSIRDARNLYYTCGGSLISRRHVLTAAHCTYQGVSTTVKLGVTSVRSNTGVTTVRVGKEGMILHPRYNPRTLANDISVLILPSMVTLTDNIKIIPLPKQAWADPATFDNYQVTLSGFGGVVDNDTMTPHSTLQYRTIHKMPQAACVSEWGKLGGRITNGNICTDKTIYAGPCPGDSGGPLVVAVNSVRYEIGLVSYGVQEPDCSAKTPEVFTNVAYFLQWINSVTGIPLN